MGHDRHEREERWKLIWIVPLVGVVALVAILWGKSRTKEDEDLAAKRNRKLVDQLKAREEARRGIT